MWPFNRRKNDAKQDVPPEVQDYYQAEKRERTGVAWLLGLATVIITVVLAFALFFGGRWLWRTLTSNGDTTPENGTQQVEVPAPGDADEEDDEQNEDEQLTQEEREAEEAAEREREEQAAREREEEIAQENGTTARGDQEVTPQAPQDGSGTGSDESLPDTGPGAVLTIFAGTSIVSAVAHYEFSRRRRS
jgi:hypothetical protein